MEQQVNWSPKQLIAALRNHIVSSHNINQQVTGQVQFNSQDVQLGDLFIALPGGRDGHEFIEDAAIKGAAAIIVRQGAEYKISAQHFHKLIIVDDPRKALTALATNRRQAAKAKFIGVTGSVGKTSTKEGLKLVLSAIGKTYTSRGNFNNQLGVELNLASMPLDCEYVVLEMGMNRAGEIRQLALLAALDIAIITDVSEGHIGFFTSLEEVAAAKCEILTGLAARGGMAIINNQHAAYQQCLKLIKHYQLTQYLTYGTPAADIYLNNYAVGSAGQAILEYTYKNPEYHSIELQTPLVPKHLASNFAAILGVLLALKLEVSQLQQLNKYQLVPGRGNITQGLFNQHTIRIIHDYYNANPKSMQAALEFLNTFTADKKLAILGDMGELGNFSAELHQQLATVINQTNIDKLYLVGPNMSAIAPYINSRQVFTASSAQQVDLASFIDQDATVLIKGSRYMQLEKIAQQLEAS